MHMYNVYRIVLAITPMTLIAHFVPHYVILYHYFFTDLIFDGVAIVWGRKMKLHIYCNYYT